MFLRVIDAREAAKLVGLVVVIGFVAIAARRALVQAQTEPPGVLAGVRLSVGSFVASCLAGVLNGLLYYAEVDCRPGPPGAPPATMCDLTRVSLVALVLGALVYLAALFVWPPWRKPLGLQIVRGALAVAWLLAAYSFFALGIV
jgi:hypothetical protein